MKCEVCGGMHGDSDECYSPDEAGSRESPSTQRKKMKIYCCACETETEAVLTDGGEIYPHRPDLHSLPFWKCPDCLNFVGCHHKTANRTHPLGCIPSPEIKDARKHIHNVLDPLWQSGKFKRKEVYAYLSENLGWKYHTAKIRNIDEARAVYKLLTELSNNG